jgi:single-stranded DNA-binding protein
MVNKVILIGRINGQLLTRQTNNGTSITTMQISVDRSYIKQGIPTIDTSIFDCDLWGTLIEEAGKIPSGSLVCMEGRARCVRSPNIKTGGEYAFVSIVVEKITKIEETKVNREEIFQQGISDDLPF